MRTWFERTGFEMRWFDGKRGLLWLAMLFVFLIVAGCESSSGGSCMDRLNARKYTEVAADESCSTYERGSAELGLAGFEFSSFIATDALTNFPKTLNLDADGCDNYEGTESLDEERGYFSKYHQHYLRSQYYTRWSYNAAGEEQPKYDAEVALFSAAGEIASQTYCDIDSNLDGNITSDEIGSFTMISGGATGTVDIEDTGNLLVVSDGTPWIIDTSGTQWQCRQSTNPSYSSVWDRQTDTGESALECLALLTGASELSLIVRMNEVPNIFSGVTDISDLLDIFNLLFSALQKGDDVTQDLATIGFDQGTEIWDMIAAQLSVLDNGGIGGDLCSGDTETIGLLTTLSSLMENAEHAETYSESTLDLSSRNIYSMSEIEGLTGTSFSCPSGASGCGNVRLVYDNSGTGSTETDTDLYALASSDVSSNLTQLAYLTLDPVTGEPSETASEDFDVTLEELLCVQPTDSSDSSTPGADPVLP